MVVYRSCATGLYKVAWHREPSRLVVERYGPSSLYMVVNNLHFQHGYDQEGLAYRTWAIIVDVVTVSTIVWIISGIYLWRGGRASDCWAERASPRESCCSSAWSWLCAGETYGGNNGVL